MSTMLKGIGLVALGLTTAYFYPVALCVWDKLRSE